MRCPLSRLACATRSLGTLSPLGRGKKRLTQPGDDESSYFRTIANGAKACMVAID